jgi:hypothetical protein
VLHSNIRTKNGETTPDFRLHLYCEASALLLHKTCRHLQNRFPRLKPGIPAVKKSWGRQYRMEPVFAIRLRTSCSGGHGCFDGHGRQSLKRPDRHPLTKSVKRLYFFFATKRQLPPNGIFTRLETAPSSPRRKKSMIFSAKRPGALCSRRLSSRLFSLRRSRPSL